MRPRQRIRAYRHDDVYAAIAVGVVLRTVVGDVPDDRQLVHADVGSGSSCRECSVATAIGDVIGEDDVMNRRRVKFGG